MSKLFFCICGQDFCFFLGQISVNCKTNFEKTCAFLTNQLKKKKKPSKRGILRNVGILVLNLSSKSQFGKFDIWCNSNGLFFLRLSASPFLYHMMGYPNYVPLSMYVWILSNLYVTYLVGDMYYIHIYVGSC